MARITTDVPYLKLYRAGGDTYAPRWEPSPKLRRLGAKGQPLKDDAVAWLPIEAAIAKARALTAQAEALIADGRRVKIGPPRRHPRSADALWALYQASPKFQRLAPKTQAEYRKHAALFLKIFGPEPVAAIGKSDLHTWWEKLYRERGHAMANATLAVARLLLSYAEMKEWRRDNPARRLGLETVPPRVVVWLATECKAYVEKADAAGLAPAGDAFVLALHTGQRMSDVLTLDADRVVDGKAYFLQRKTNARVIVPLTPMLNDRLSSMHERRARKPVTQLALAKRLVLCHDAFEYTEKHFNTHFRQVRDAIAKDMPDVANRQFRDLRDTAITRLALAGATIAEIRSITGHTIKSVHQVLEHYMALDEAMADRAIDRLKVWMQDQGIAI